MFKLTAILSEMPSLRELSDLLTERREKKSARAALDAQRAEKGITIDARKEDALTLYAILKDGIKGAAEFFLLKKIHQIEDLGKGEKGDTGLTGPQGERGTPGKDGVDGKSIVGPAGRDGIDGVDGINGIGLPGKDGINGSPDTPLQIADKLNSTEESVEISVIKGLREKLEKVVKSVSPERVQTPAKAYRVRTADCSGQCDGVNKAFSAGGTHFGIVGVFCTEFPIVYRPVIDYTETPTGILLTSQVSAPISGQTLVIQFLK